MQTWYDIKLASLKKVDPAITSLTVTRNTKDYLNAIIPVANRGLQDLATAGKFIVKHYDLIVPELTNSIEDADVLTQHLNEDIEITSVGKAYSFEICGKGTVYIYVGDALAKTIQNTEKNSFVTYKGILSNDDDEEVKIVFSGLYPYSFRNVAVYDVNFETDEDVWEYSLHRRFDLRELVDDFYRLVTKDLVYEDGEYEKYRDYEWEGDSVLILNGTESGHYRIHYYAYPQEITVDTEDTEIMALDPEVAAILPLYIASELYEDDDTSTAYYFRQQYDEAKQRLVSNVNTVTGATEFKDVWGW